MSKNKTSDERRAWLHEKLMKLEEILAGRGDNYAGPAKNFERIAAYWNVDLADKLKEGAEIDWKDVMQLMLSLKKARLLHVVQSDSLFDTAGYALCGLEIEEDESREEARAHGRPQY